MGAILECLRTRSGHVLGKGAAINMAFDDRSRAAMQSCSRIACGVVGIVSVLVLAGWTFDVMLLKQIAPGLVAMNPLTAVCFMSLAVALLALNPPTAARSRRRNVLGMTLASLVMAAGVIRLTAYVLGWT